MRRLARHHVLWAVVLVLIIVFSALAVGGCGDQASAQSGLAKLTETDNGSAVAMNTGDLMEVVLSGNGGTGYLWRTALGDKETAVLQQQGGAAYVQDYPKTAIAAVGGTFTFTFKAVAPGQATLRFAYTRMWKSAPPLKTYSVTITVK